MRRFTHISLILAAFLALMPGDDLRAKGGRGASKGGGGNGHKGTPSFHGHGGGGKSGAAPSHHGKEKPSFAAKRDAKKQILNDSDQPWTKHQAREQRKLEHRQQVADHLREVSDRNGNQHLKQVADEMDERALAHYDKQMEKINENQDLDDPAEFDESPKDSGDFFNSTNKKLDGLDGKLTGPENAAARQLRNEVRTLTRRMEAVERMRALGEQSGDEGMLQAADRLEQQALDHFHKRMEKLGEFRQRHGLPDINHHHAP